MATPQWQKSHIIKDGKVVWVKVGPPTGMTSNSCDEKGRPTGEIKYLVGWLCNVIDCDGRPFAIDRELVELLPQFADEVPMLSLREFQDGKEQV